LSGVAGTGKTHVALSAARRVASHPLLVEQIQFHQGYSYDDFVEGLFPTKEATFEPRAGIFTALNEQALADPENRYVLLIEELTRASISSVLGELMTYIEHRDRVFRTPVRRRELRVAPNLVVLATMNPRDRSALELDEAIIRRLRIVECPPDVEQLREMFPDGMAEVEDVVALFEGVRAQHPDTFESLMPFGHGMFAGVRGPADLHDLWHQRIKHLLERPSAPHHPFAKAIKSRYPWHAPEFAVGPAEHAAGDEGQSSAPHADGARPREAPDGQ
jgi:5-methylcytosine-specific restriction protein B